MSVGNRRNDGGYYTHDTIKGDGETISGSTMSSGENLWRICIQTTVVDVDAEGDNAAKGNVLVRSMNCRVAKEECHGDESAYDHGVFPAE
jgi:hypothetical protein